MKVKLFFKEDSYTRRALVELENEINAWLQSNPSIQIKHIKQTETEPRLSSPRSTLISVWYGEP